MWLKLQNIKSRSEYSQCKQYYYITIQIYETIPRVNFRKQHIGLVKPSRTAFPKLWFAYHLWYKKDLQMVRLKIQKFLYFFLLILVNVRLSSHETSFRPQRKNSYQLSLQTMEVFTTMSVSQRHRFFVSIFHGEK